MRIFSKRRGLLAILLAGSCLVASAGLSPALADSTATTQAGCTPASGSINVGATVNCNLTLAPGASFLFWYNSGFTPTFNNNPAATFTAATPGAGAITAVYIDSTGVHEPVFNYTIAASTATSTANCSVPSGSTITVGSAVSCSFSPAPGASLIFWTARGFNPLFSHNASDTFTAQSVGPASIIATYQDRNGAHQVTFNYTIQAAPTV